MLNSYDSYLPNTTLDQTSAFLSAVAPYNSLLLFGNSGSAGFSGTGGPSFPNGNYIYVRPSHTRLCPERRMRRAALFSHHTMSFVTCHGTATSAMEQQLS